MSCSFGTLYRVTLFGESHSSGIGAVLDGLPAGLVLDLDDVRAAMQRRAPGSGPASTTRCEKDEFEILSGFLDGHTTGTPLAVLIRNKDTRSEDYLRTAHLLRPGHADYTGYIKYSGFGDIRGGGHFSGRITAPLVFAGAAARQALRAKGIIIGAHILRISDIVDSPYRDFTEEELLVSEARDFPVQNEEAASAMLKRVADAKKAEDSLGGIIECAIAGVPPGLGEPFFDNMESELSHMIFSVPAVKGIEFGDGFALARMKGSEANDSPYVEDGTVTFLSNHNGGINGGITNGMPIVFRVVIRPTASISQPQPTIDIHEMKNSTLRLHGRHDACIVPRAVEVIKQAAACVLYDLYLRRGATEYARK